MVNSIAKVRRFSQIKCSIRHASDYLLVGIDVSKGSSIACFYNLEKGTLVSKYRILHTREGFEVFLKMTEDLKDKHSCSEVVFGLEPTGNYHKVLCEYLQNREYVVVYVSGVAAKNNRATIHGGRWGKNDPRDAYNVVDLMAQGKILFYRGESEECSDFRRYIYLHQRLTQMKSACKHRIRNNILACYFPELENMYSNIEDSDILTILEKCPSAEDIKLRTLQSFINLFTIKTKARHNRLVKVWNMAQQSIGYTTTSSARFEASVIIADIKKIQRDLKFVDQKLKQFCATTDSYMQLLTIPGFGIFNTAVFKAIVGNIDKFSHPQQLVKLAGIDLEMKQSGSYRGHEQISKKGNSMLRYALSSAVNIAISKNKKIRELFVYKLNALGNTKSAKAKLKIKFIEKYIRIAFAILKNNVPFNIDCLTDPVREPAHNYVRA